VATTLPSGQRISHRFDVAGRRASVELGGITQHLLPFNGLQLIAQQNANGQLTQRYVYAAHSHAPDLLWRQGLWYRVIKDVRGSVRLVVSIDDGTVAQRLDYDEFGRVTADSSPGFQPFGFAGGLYDHRSGLVLFGYRVYDPFTGRFLTRDPLWHGGGHSNLYLYVANEPVNFFDPDGLWAFPVIPALYFAAGVYLAAGYDVSTSPSASNTTGGMNIAGKIWAAPNTVVGLIYGFVITTDRTPNWEFKENAIVVYNHPFQSAAGASITLGNAICYHEEK
jgi:RHS repeat-associated protein